MLVCGLEHVQLPLRYEPATLFAMTTALPHSEAALNVGEYNGIPLVRVNYVPDDVRTGNEMANIIMDSLATLVPECIHSDCQFNEID